MGGGSSKAHESFTVTPTSSVNPAIAEWSTSLAALDDLPPPIGVVYSEVIAAYETFAQHVTAAKAALAGAHTDPAEALVAAGMLTEEAADWLEQLDDNTLEALAASQGFEHPTLIGFSSGAATPLVNWLNPAGDDDVQAKIAAKAQDRYELLAAGETIHGLTLDDVQAAEADLPQPKPEPTQPSVLSGSWDTWDATPDLIAKRQAALKLALDHLASQECASDPAAYAATALGHVLRHENALATASCPEMGDKLDQIVATSRQAVTDAGIVTDNPLVKDALGARLDYAAEQGKFFHDAAAVTTPDEALALLRASTPADERAALVKTVAQRKADAQSLASAWEKLTTYKPVMDAPGGNGTYMLQTGLGLPSLDTPGDVGEIVGFVYSARIVSELHPEVASWADSTITPPEPLAPSQVHYSPTGLTTAFTSWANYQGLDGLQKVAQQTDLEHASHATKGQAWLWIAAQWDPTINKDTVAASVQSTMATAPTVTPAAAPTALTGAGTPKTAAAVAAPPEAAAGGAGGWLAKHKALVGALKHHAASVTKLPTRHSTEDVAGWAFTPAHAPVGLGGAHTKSVWTAPDSSPWMFKPDKTAGGARAHSEAAVSAVFDRVGVPAVPVYARTLDGKVGSIQPLVPGATSLNAKPSAWSQADVDAMVRYHVAAWAVGDHDGKPDNLLRTNAGGLIPVDGGQAFKFYGRDRLSTDYHPNSSAGVSQPVFHVAYKAAKTNSLGHGVKIRPEAALGVIKAFEAMPDTDYRALLHTTAHEGAKHSGTAWAKPMRDHAAKTLGKPAATVTTGEVAKQFLDHAVDRKNNLRSQFAAFFAGAGFAGAGKLTKVT